MDYIGLSRILSFAACETRQCVDVVIVDELVDEPHEKFDITLERTPDLNSMIILDPVEEEIFIQDDGKLTWIKSIRKLVCMSLVFNWTHAK